MFLWLSTEFEQHLILTVIGTLAVYIFKLFNYVFKLSHPRGETLFASCIGIQKQSKYFSPSKNVDCKEARRRICSSVFCWTPSRNLCQGWTKEHECSEHEAVVHFESRTVPVFSADLWLPAHSQQHIRSCDITNVVHLLQVAASQPLQHKFIVFGNAV